MADNYAKEGRQIALYAYDRKQISSDNCDIIEKLRDYKIGDNNEVDQKLSNLYKRLTDPTNKGIARQILEEEISKLVKLLC